MTAGLRAGTEPAAALPTDADVVVVGAGLMGSATAWAATRRGLSVVVLEQFEIGNTHGSSHGSARIVRRAYPDPVYARLTGEALELWRELELDSRVPLLRLVGGLDHGSRRDVRQIAATLSALDVPHELLDATEAERRWPGMVFATEVVHHPQAGTVDAAGAVLAAMRRATARGASVHPGTRVTGVHVQADGTARVVTDRGTVRAGTVVVAAGAWAGRLLADAGVSVPALEVTQQQVFHFPRRDGVPEWPVVVHDDVLGTYSLPGGRDGGPDGARKVAEHMSGAPGSRPTTATTRSGVVDPVARRRIVDHVTRWLPGLVPEPFAESTCLYTTTANEDFVLDRVGPVVVCSPCSGHGAKFTPLIGELVTDLVLGGVDAAEARFRLAAHGLPAAV